MYASFLQIVRDHRARYPLMQPQDYGKLAFQSEYGPKHLAGRIVEVFSMFVPKIRKRSAAVSAVFRYLPDGRNKKRRFLQNCLF